VTPTKIEREKEWGGKKGAADESAVLLAEEVCFGGLPDVGVADIKILS